MLANQLFPNWLITVLLLLLLIFLTHMTVKKALSLHRAEVLYKTEQAADTCSSARAKADSSEGHASASSAQQQGDAAARAADFCEAGSSSDGAPEGGAGDGRGKAAAGAILSHACASLEVEQPVSLLLWAVHKMLQSQLAMWNTLYPGSCMLAARRSFPSMLHCCIQCACNFFCCALQAALKCRILRIEGSHSLRHGLLKPQFRL